MPSRRPSTHASRAIERVRTDSTNSDCIILTKQRHDGPPIIARQVIEGLKHDKQARRVEITLILEMENPGPVPARARAVHRGDVEGWLVPFSFRRKDPALCLLRRLYADRIVQNTGGKPATALFYPRVNCLAVAQEPLEVSLWQPEGYDGDKAPKVRLEQECDKGKKPSFTSFLLPEIGPGERGLFMLRLEFGDPTYKYLVEQFPWFAVSSYTRLLGDIAAFDLSNASPEAKDLFRADIEPAEAHIVPQAYDIVLFQRLGDPVEVMDESICILPVRHEDARLAQEVLWFYGKPASEFYLELCFAESRPTAPPRNCFVVAAGHPHREERLAVASEEAVG